jgi:hypothetical protein
MLADPAVLRMQYAQGHGDPAVDVRAEQERVRLERTLAALDREVTRLVDAYQAEVIALTELRNAADGLTTTGGCSENAYGRSPNNGASGAQSSDFWKGWTLFVPVSERPWRNPLLRSSRRCYS